MLVAAFVGGFLVFGLISHSTIEAVKVNGDAYRRVVLGKDLIADILPPPAYILEANLVVHQLADEADPEAIDALVTKGEQLRKDFETRYAFWQQNLVTPASRAELEAAAAAARRFFETRDRVLIPAVRAGDRDAARSLVRGELREAYEEHRAAIDRLVATATTENAATEAAAAALVTDRSGLATAAGVGSLLMVLAVATWVGRSLAGALRQNTADLREQSQSLADAATRVAEASQTLAHGASSQAGNLQETAAAIEEVASMTRQNVANAATAKEAARKARLAVESGVGEMSELATSLEAIRASSDDIGKILKVIDEIAFQTNILALNAAVEAARAGESGAGFAVVADEVRALAQRSARAAGETTEKVRESLSRAEAGVAIGARVHRLLDQIAARTKETDELVAGISVASEEQSRGVDQTNTSVNHMSRVTQETAGVAQEVASASAVVNDQASSLRLVVGSLERLAGSAAA